MKSKSLIAVIYGVVSGINSGLVAIFLGHGIVSIPLGNAVCFGLLAIVFGIESLRGEDKE
jgi:hypothetical protein